jgi:hypothetical protein
MRRVPQSLEALRTGSGRLRGQGLEDCLSMAGGIDRWSIEIDPAIPRYA